MSKKNPLTRCSNCQTVFEVSSDLLSSDDTRVRCGECISIFDALEELVVRADTNRVITSNEASNSTISESREQPNIHWYRFADKWLPIDAKEMVFAMITDYKQEIDEAMEAGDVEKARARAKVGNVLIGWNLVKLFLSEINPLKGLLK